MSGGIGFKNDLPHLGYVYVYTLNWDRLIAEGPIPAGGVKFVELPGNTYSVRYFLDRFGTIKTASDSPVVIQGGTIDILFSKVIAWTVFRGGLLHSSDEVSIDAKAAGQTAGAVLDEEALKSYVAAGGNANDDISNFVAALKEKHLKERPDAKPEISA